MLPGTARRVNTHRASVLRPGSAPLSAMACGASEADLGAAEDAGGVVARQCAKATPVSTMTCSDAEKSLAVPLAEILPVWAQLPPDQRADALAELLKTWGVPDAIAGRMLGLLEASSIPTNP